jgi:uncharacterized protein YcbK (DUF882 family)
VSRQVTDHFNVAEFACKSGHLYPDTWVEARLRPLCETLEVLRRAIDRPIVIVSGYRDEDYNRRVGGAKASQHVQGRAADVRVAAMDAGLLYAKVLELYGQGALPYLGGLGRYRTWVHVDVRHRQPGQVIARWEDKGVDVG